MGKLVRSCEGWKQSSLNNTHFHVILPSRQHPFQVVYTYMLYCPAGSMRPRQCTPTCYIAQQAACIPSSVHLNVILPGRQHAFQAVYTHMLYCPAGSMQCTPTCYIARQAACIPSSVHLQIILPGRQHAFQQLFLRWPYKWARIPGLQAVYTYISSGQHATYAGYTSTTPPCLILQCLSCAPVLCPHDAVCPAGSMRPTQCTSPWRKIEAEETCVYSETFVVTMCVIAAGNSIF